MIYDLRFSIARGSSQLMDRLDDGADDGAVEIARAVFNADAGEAGDGGVQQAHEAENRCWSPPLARPKSQASSICDTFK